MTMRELIENELLALGITKCYRGYSLTIQAVLLALEKEDRLLNVSKEIYPLVAELCGTKPANVERNIRTAAGRAWKKAPERLQQIARYPLSSPPTASDFITILLNHIQRALEAKV